MNKLYPNKLDNLEERKFHRLLSTREIESGIKKSPNKSAGPYVFTG